MKKFSVILLALALSVALAAPAMAVHVGSQGTVQPDGRPAFVDIGGKYTLDGQYDDFGNAGNDAFYDDDFELVIKLGTGPVTGVVDLELADTDPTRLGWASHRNDEVIRPSDIVDNYWVTWQASDAILFKAGEYGVQWGRKAAIYNSGGRNWQLSWGLDPVDLGLVVSKIREGNEIFVTPSTGGEAKDADIDQYTIWAKFNSAGPFTKLDFYYAYIDAQEFAPLNRPVGDSPYDTFVQPATDGGLFGIDVAVPIGPVTLSGEIAAGTGDLLEGTLGVLEVGLDELLGFDLSWDFFYSSEEFRPLGTTDQPGTNSDYTPLQIYGDDLNPNWNNTTATYLRGGYGFNEKMYLGANLGIFAATDDTKPVPIFPGSMAIYGVPVAPAVGADNLGTEFDVTFTYKIAPNVTYFAALGFFMGDSSYIDEDITQIWHRFTFTF